MSRNDVHSFKFKQESAFNHAYMQQMKDTQIMRNVQWCPVTTIQGHVSLNTIP